MRLPHGFCRSQLLRALWQGTARGGCIGAFVYHTVDTDAADDGADVITVLIQNVTRGGPNAIKRRKTQAFPSFFFYLK